MYVCMYVCMYMDDVRRTRHSASARSMPLYYLAKTGRIYMHACMHVCMYVCMYVCICAVTLSDQLFYETSVPITRLIDTYYYFLLNTDDIKYTIKTNQDFKFMYVCMLVCEGSGSGSLFL